MSSDVDPGHTPSDEELAALGLGDRGYTDESPADFHAFMRWMLDHGAHADELAAAVSNGMNHVWAMRNELVFLGSGELDATAFAARVNVPIDTLNEWWRLLRLPWLTVPGKRFGDDDVRVALTVRNFVRSLPEEHAADALRTFGAGMQQMAHGLLDAWRIGVQAPIENTAITNAGFSESTLSLGEAVRKTWPAFLYGLFWRHFSAAVIDDPVVRGDYRSAEAEVTILFVDLVEFTRLSQRVDFEELSAILSAFERVAAEIAHAFEGRLVKLLGDGAMYQFADRGHAIEAGLASVAGHPELPPRRAGVATGRAVSRQADFFGPVVNLAARLATAAAPGELVVDREPAGIASEQMDPVVLKGYDEPVTPYRVSST